MIWRSDKHGLKSEFVVSSGADVRVIKLVYSGEVHVGLGESGCLLVRGANSTIREDPPVAYTIGPRGRIPMRAGFRVAHNQVSFDVGPYDHTATLVIDPVLFYSTLLSGAGHDSATGIAVDTAGNAYVAGWTESFNFPV